MLNKRYSETDKQTNRQTDKQTNRQTDRLSLYFLRAIQSSYIGLESQQESGSRPFCVYRKLNG